MAFDEGLIEWVRDAMTPIGVVAFRRMMGGATLYCDGAVFAIVTQDSLWFKSDAVSDAEWDAADCARFSYDRGGATATMNYRHAPEDVYDDADALRRWATLGLAAGLRAPVRKSKPRRQSRSTRDKPHAS